MRDGTRTRLLLVEDNAQSAGLYRRFLADTCDVTWAKALEDGRRLAEAENPEVVVLDLQIPSEPDAADEDTRHGLRLLDRILELDPFRPIVVLTAHHDRSLMRQVLQRTRGGQFVFKDDDEIERALLGAIATAVGGTAWQMAKTVRVFKGLVGENRPEDDYRRFMFEHWRVLLGPGYVDCRSPYEIARGAEIDLLGVRADGYTDLWELKRPDQAIFRTYNQWLHYSLDCAKAQGQLMEYIRLAMAEPSGHPRGVDRRRGLIAHTHRPRGFVVIGRYSQDADEAAKQRDWLHMSNSFLAGLQVLTYDDVVEQAEQLVEFVRDARNGHGLS